MRQKNLLPVFDFMSNVSNYAFGESKEENMKNKNIFFSAVLKGFHVYKSIRKPEESEVLMCYHDKDNPYQTLSIKVCKSGEVTQIVGHLLMEISRITHFILQIGETVSAKNKW